jgi:hypothetical protein
MCMLASSYSQSDSSRDSLVPPSHNCQKALVGHHPYDKVAITGAGRHLAHNDPMDGTIGADTGATTALIVENSI